MPLYVSANLAIRHFPLWLAPGLPAAIWLGPRGGWRIKAGTEHRSNGGDLEHWCGLVVYYRLHRGLLELLRQQVKELDDPHSDTGRKASLKDIREAKASMQLIEDAVAELESEGDSLDAWSPTDRQIDGKQDFVTAAPEPLIDREALYESMGFTVANDTEADKKAREDALHKAKAERKQREKEIAAAKNAAAAKSFRVSDREIPY